jgi:hypothetical protein
LFVKVNFEPSYLGEEPTEPQAPREPAAFDPSAPLKALRPGESEVDAQSNFEIAKKAYEDELTQFEKDTKEFEEKLKKGIEKANELNKRLGAWYYVVPAENVEALRVTRVSLVQPKGTDDKEAQNSGPQGGGIPGTPGLPNLPPGLQLPK